MPTSFELQQSTQAYITSARDLIFDLTRFCLFVPPQLAVQLILYPGQVRQCAFLHAATNREGGQHNNAISLSLSPRSSAALASLATTRLLIALQSWKGPICSQNALLFCSGLPAQYTHAIETVYAHCITAQHTYTLNILVLDRFCSILTFLIMTPQRTSVLTRTAAVTYQREEEEKTPVKDRLRKEAAKRKGTPTAQPEADRHHLDDDDDAVYQPSNNSRSAGPVEFIVVTPTPSPAASLPATPAEMVPTPFSPAPLSKKTRKRLRKREKQSAEDGVPDLVDGRLTPLENESSSRVDWIASRSTSLQSLDGSLDYPFSPSKTLNDRADQNSLSKTAEKRDSVISNDWGHAETPQTLQSPDKTESWFSAWYSKLRPKTRWPYRAYTRGRTVVVALFRSFMGSRQVDCLIVLGFLLVCSYIAYIALDFILTGLIKGVNAQDLIRAANCSVVYVTIPGPIITVSLIAASPTNPAQGTYYYSVVSGSTEWLNSMAPPSRTGIPISRSTSAVLTSSDVPSIASSGQALASTAVASSLASFPPMIGSTLVSTFTSGDEVIISTSVLRSSSILLPSMSSDSPARPETSSRDTTSAIV